MGAVCLLSSLLPGIHNHIWYHDYEYEIGVLGGIGGPLMIPDMVVQCTLSLPTIPLYPLRYYLRYTEVGSDSVTAPSPLIPYVTYVSEV